MNKVTVGIVGGAGYVGGEIIRLLLNHNNCSIKYVLSQSQSGNPVSSIHPDLKGWTDLVFSENFEKEVDVLFICMGHGKSKEFLNNVSINKECLVIDLSRDFRLKEDAEGFIYGLCELNKEEITKAIKIANPGCFATCIQLGLIPLAAENHLNADIHITAVTGSTGAGQRPVPTTHNSWRNNNISIYKPFNHQHLAEVKQSVNQLQSTFINEIHFVPMRGSFTRGIFASIYLNSDLTEKQAINIYKDYYQSSPFVHISNEPISVKEVVNTNNALIYLSKHDDKLRIESTIDNLLKGAAGQAVQNMNLSMGWKEDTGLRLKGSAF